MNKFMILIIVMMLTITSVQASLGSFPINSIVKIRVLANCSNVNLTEVTNGANTYNINSAMTKIGGQTFVYNFSNTREVGHYTFSWNNPCTDCSDGSCGNSFDITPTGEEQTDIGGVVLMIGFLIIGGIAIFFLVYQRNRFIGDVLFMIMGVGIWSKIGNGYNSWIGIIIFISGLISLIYDIMRFTKGSAELRLKG